MTPMTSSAASDTDSARNLVRPVGVRRSTSTPPPPGRWTSSSTTSGAVAAMTSTASSTSPASPTTLTESPSSAFTPLRNIWWSSTSTTRVISRLASLGFTPHLQSDLRALAEGRTDLGFSAVALHASDDGLAQAHAVVGDGVEVEALATVAYEDRDLVARDLCVDRQRRRDRPAVRRLRAGPVVGGVLGGVDHGLACGLEHRA